MAYVTKSPWVVHYDGSSCNGCADSQGMSLSDVIIGLILDFYKIFDILIINNHWMRRIPYMDISNCLFCSSCIYCNWNNIILSNRWYSGEY